VTTGPDIRTGSAAALALLVSRHRSAVWVIARNMCATVRDAEEVVRQTFLSVWHDAGALPADAGFAIWLYRTAMRNALALSEQDVRRPSCSLEPLLPVFDSAGCLVPDKGRWSEVEERKIGPLLHEAMECLDDQTRAAFVLRDLLDLPLEQVAMVLETAPAAVNQQAHRARLMLRGFIEWL